MWMNKTGLLLQNQILCGYCGEGVSDFVDAILSVRDLSGVEDLSNVSSRGRIVISIPRE